MSDQATGAATGTAIAPDPVAETETGTTQTVNVGQVEEPVKLFTQADIDRAVSRATATRENKLKEEMETARLKETNNFAELSRRQEAEITSLKENAVRSAFVQERGHSRFASAYEMVPISKLEDMAKSIEASLNEEVTRRVSKKLETPTPIQGVATTPKAIKDMTTEEYAAYKQARGPNR